MPKHKTLHASPDAVEQAFYDALEHADLDALMQLWSDDEEIVCTPPGGPRLVGHTRIREFWREIFTNGPIHVRPGDINVVQGTMVSVHSLAAQLIVRDGNQTNLVDMVMSNVFFKGTQGWRLILHHASVAPQDQAASAVSGKGSPGSSSNVLH